MLLASIVKEARVLLRDREGLAILFLMPLVFVVIMSLALQDFFRPGGTARLSMLVLDQDDGLLGQRLTDELSALDGLRPLLSSSDDPRAWDRANEAVRRGDYPFALVVPKGSADRLRAAIRARSPASMLEAQPKDRIELAFLADPSLRSDQRMLVRSALERMLLALEVELTVRELAGPNAPSASPRSMQGLLVVADASPTGAPRSPSATQQNVPAYSLLAIFLLVVPLSTTFIKERDQGTLTRLRTMPVPIWTVLGGKIAPYFAINLVQMAFCLAVGRWLVPALGGEALEFDRSMLGAVVLLACAASLAAIGFALVVAMIARTPEQATAFGATGVLLMAALGGVMVPKTIMPGTLQQVAAISPMGWALDGFLEAFVRGAGLTNVLPTASALTLFAAACLSLAAWRFGAMMRAA